MPTWREKSKGINEMLKWIIAVVLLLCATELHACNRCGLFGNRCRFVQSHVVESHVQVAPVAAYKAPEVFVVQNNYPAPNGGAAILAQQGATIYQPNGYQQAAQAYLVNPADVLRQAAELTRAAQKLAGDGLNGYQQTVTSALTLQSTLAEPLIRSQAAAQVLSAAGLNQPPAQQQSLALRITRGLDGQWQVSQADAAQITAKVEQKIEARPTEQVSSEASVLSAKCASCHGKELTQPKAGLYIDAGIKLDCKTALKSLQLIKSGKMPKDGTLTPEEKGAILDELLQNSKEE